MNKVSTLFSIFLLMLPFTQNAKRICLPEGFELTDVVSYRHDAKGDDQQITIKDKLEKLKARCKQGRLFDGKGKEIRFFRLACFGNPPADYDEIRQKENEALEKLQKDYTVIVLECDPHIR